LLKKKKSSGQAQCTEPPHRDHHQCFSPSSSLVLPTLADRAVLGPVMWAQLLCREEGENPRPILTSSIMDQNGPKQHRRTSIHQWFSSFYAALSLSKKEVSFYAISLYIYNEKGLRKAYSAFHIPRKKVTSVLPPRSLFTTVVHSFTTAPTTNACAHALPPL
jgi:hypothetical protein